MNNSSRIFPVCVLLTILYFAFFFHLARQPVRLWDESRVAANAYEMYKDGDLIVMKYMGQPDMWNLKPPFLVWCQCFMMKVFGPWEFAVRFPSALAGFLTALMIFIFTWKIYDRFWLGWIAAVVLSTTKGYMTFHGARTGDFDSMLTFFITFYALAFLLFYERGKWKYFYWGIAGIIFASLTKGIAGLLFLPGIVIAGFYFKKIKAILLSRHFYISLLLFVITVGGYYLLREKYNPGYLQAVIDNEWGGRYSNVIEGHDGPFWVYYENLHSVEFVYWALLIPCGIFTGMLDNEKRFRTLTMYITFLTIIFWLILSIGKTKILWYMYPAFPFLSIIIATFLYYVFQWIETVETTQKLKFKILPFAFLFLVCYNPYKEIMDSNSLDSEYDWDKPSYRMSYYLRDLAKGRAKMDKIVNVVFDSYTQHFQFYVEILNKDSERARIKSKENLETGDFVICSEQVVDNYIRNTYQFEEVTHGDNLYGYKINGRK
jgi:4-amino-4-deoxy-L-arabinose transferase-like glycosyltransferase